MHILFLPRGSFLLRLAAAEELFLFGIKKKQKLPAENLFICIIVFSCIHEGFAVFFRSQQVGLGSAARKIC